MYMTVCGSVDAAPCRCCNPAPKGPEAEELEAQDAVKQQLRLSSFEPFGVQQTNLPPQRVIATGPHHNILGAQRLHTYRSLSVALALLSC